MFTLVINILADFRLSKMAGDLGKIDFRFICLWLKKFHVLEVSKEEKWAKSARALKMFAGTFFPRISLLLGGGTVWP
jgi:hypothetical protein